MWLKCFRTVFSCNTATVVAVLPVPPIPCITTQLVNRLSSLGSSSSSTSVVCTGRSWKLSRSKCWISSGTFASSCDVDGVAVCALTNKALNPAFSISVVSIPSRS